MDAQEIVYNLAPDGWSVERVPVPGYRRSEAAACLESCRGNLCGCYGTSWACPPGWTRGLDSLAEEFDGAMLLSRTFMCRPDDVAALRAAGDESHRLVRDAMLALRSSGYGCMGFSDGACGYCGVCAYPDECRFPGMLVPSISAIGLDLGRFLGELGRGFEFRDNRVTLYCLLLYRADGARRHIP